MQLQTIYPTSGIPFFYIIQHIPTGKYYAGVKYALNDRTTDSSIFMTEAGYQTSSDIIAEIIQKEGLAAFKIRKIRHFESKHQVIRYEYRFLNKIDAKNNPNWLNKHNGGSKRHSNFGLKMSNKTKLKMSKSKLGKKMSEETKRKISIAHKGKKKKPEHLLNMSKSRIGKSLPNHSKETKAKISLSLKGNKNSLGFKHSLETRKKMTFAVRQRFAQKCH